MAAPDNRHPSMIDAWFSASDSTRRPAPANVETVPKLAANPVGNATAASSPFHSASAVPSSPRPRHEPTTSPAAPEPPPHPPSPPQMRRWGRQLDPSPQAAQPHLLHRGKRSHPFFDRRTQLIGASVDVGEHVPLLVQLQVSLREGCGQRVPAVGVAVIERV